MIIKLTSGKELTMEEVKEVIEIFRDLPKETKKTYVPAPVYVYPTYPIPSPFYWPPVITC